MPDKNLEKLHPMQDFGVVPSLHSPLRIQKLEDRLKPLVPFPHKHSFYHLVIVMKAKGWHEIDFHKYNFEKGRVFLMKPAQVHSWVLEKGASGYVIEFEEDVLKSHPTLYGKIKNLVETLPDSFLIPTANLNKIKTDCDKMLTTYQDKEEYFEESTLLSLFLMLFSFSKINKISEPLVSPIESFESRFNNLLEANFRTHHDVEFYAKKLNITAKALTMKMSRRTRKSARHLIQDRLLLEAKRLLAYSDFTVAEIASQLGYEDANYFSRFFKTKTKKTPLTFRTTAKSL
ncbi:helix-turn-helix domain-containing protein [Bdellovibrio reynosensis]|uniref:AraC family transcriptional regulator n=1 Tax=Bdellovibrio reynosensis TaxID=2835041 RepID=A0ABY4CGJ5_9BACT|nr:helix-turn-helix domain-containing protein [Bdellovibrio reynosensis]UOF01330.1 AraC family transcriptional regulator [Bdellovibrio reynosensis]